MRYSKLEILDLFRNHTLLLRNSISDEPSSETQAVWGWEDARYQMMRDYWLKQETAATAVTKDDDDFNIVITTKEKHR